MSNPYAVVIDASVLAKHLHRLVIMALANADLFRPIWSDTILSEAESAMNKMGQDGAKYRQILEKGYPSAMADSSYIHLMREFQLKDDGDRHVVAAALQEQADAICTDNPRDFGWSSVDILTSDQFISQTVDLSPPAALEALSSLRRSLSRFSDGAEFVDLLRKRGLAETATYLEQYVDRL